jgi:AcrR family transcriptional regulator
MSTTHPARRTPVQGRSQETVQKVLATTAALLARGLAVETLTTATVAAEAHVSIGALYRFFPDKQAIVDAIALRHMETFQEALASRMMLAFPPDAPAFLGAIVDAFVDYLAANPDFRTIAFGAGGRSISGRTRDAYAASGGVSDMVRSVLSEVFGLEVDAAFELRLRLAIEAGERLLAYAFDQEAPDRAGILAETRRILAATLFG